VSGETLGLISRSSHEDEATKSGRAASISRPSRSGTASRSSIYDSASNSSRATSISAS